MRNALEAAKWGFNNSDWKEKTGIETNGRKPETEGKDAQPFQISGHLFTYCFLEKINFLQGPPLQGKPERLPPRSGRSHCTGRLRLPPWFWR